jgi:hypothetical protein
MANVEEKRELGASLICIGFALWVMALLVLFYLPAGIKIGRQAGFLGMIVALLACGLAAVIGGYRRWARANEVR